MVAAAQRPTSVAELFDIAGLLCRYASAASCCGCLVAQGEAGDACAAADGVVDLGRRPVLPGQDEADAAGVARLRPPQELPDGVLVKDGFLAEQTSPSSSSTGVDAPDGAQGPTRKELDAAAAAFEAELQSPAVVRTAIIRLPRRSSPIILHWDALRDGILRISLIKENSPIDLFNISASEDDRIHEGDCIVAVDGHPWSVATSPKFRLGGDLELKLVRPHRFVLRGLVSSMGDLGLEIRFSDRSSAIYIAGIRPEGLIHTWNLQEPRLAVQPGDFIVGVNGLSGLASDLLADIGKADVFDLTVDRICEA